MSARSTVASTRVSAIAWLLGASLLLGACHGQIWYHENSATGMSQQNGEIGIHLGCPRQHVKRVTISGHNATETPLPSAANQTWSFTIVSDSPTGAELTQIVVGQAPDGFSEVGAYQPALWDVLDYNAWVFEEGYGVLEARDVGIPSARTFLSSEGLNNWAFGDARSGTFEEYQEFDSVVRSCKGSS